jgi:hypothetical protein
MPPQAATATTTPASTRGDSSAASNASQSSKIMITGDDILIEYVSRLMNTFSSGSITEEDLTQDQFTKIEKFITHYVWYAQDKNSDKKD